jgi:ribonuclease R
MHHPGEMPESLQDDTSKRDKPIHDWNVLRQEYPDIPRTYNHREYEEALEEAEDIVSYVDENHDDIIGDELEERIDLRHLPTFTIDPHNAKDYDDAISIEDEGDLSRVYVHVADVSHYVEEGGVLEQAAYERGGVTWYLKDNTRPLFPADLTSRMSLTEDEDKLAVTVEMLMDQNGEFHDIDIYKSVVNSDAQLSHAQGDALVENAEDLLEGVEQGQEEDDIFLPAGEDEHGHEYEDIEAPASIVESLQEADKLKRDLRDQRWDKSFILNDKDYESSKIVEELMIKANKAAAHYMHERSLPGVYRTERYPKENWKEKTDQNMEAAGITHAPELGGASDRKAKIAINDFFKHKANGSRKEARKAIVTTFIPAQWEANKGGHFGLGIEINGSEKGYVQMTSPIRRLTDLKNHQILFGESGLNQDYLEDIAEKQTDIYRKADEASDRWKA